MSDSTEMTNSSLWSAETAISDVPGTASTAVQASPKLSHRGLTIMLALMCIVPTTTVLLLFNYMPAVKEGQLKARFSATGLPDQDFYAVEYYQREEFSGGELVVSNQEKEEWTHLNIQVNGSYQIYDIEPIPANTTKTYKLEKFISRSGAKFSLRYNELNSARIYARRPGGERATFWCEFSKGLPVETEKGSSE